MVLTITPVSLKEDYTSFVTRYFLEEHRGNEIFDIANFATFEEADNRRKEILYA